MQSSLKFTRTRKKVILSSIDVSFSLDTRRQTRLPLPDDLLSHTTDYGAPISSNFNTWLHGERQGSRPLLTIVFNYRSRALLETWHEFELPSLSNATSGASSSATLLSSNSNNFGQSSGRSNGLASKRQSNGIDSSQENNSSSKKRKPSDKTKVIETIDLTEDD